MNALQADCLVVVGVAVIAAVLVGMDRAAIHLMAWRERRRRNGDPS